MKNRPEHEKDRWRIFASLVTVDETGSLILAWQPGCLRWVEMDRPIDDANVKKGWAAISAHGSGKIFNLSDCPGFHPTRGRCQPGDDRSIATGLLVSITALYDPL